MESDDNLEFYDDSDYGEDDYNCISDSDTGNFSSVSDDEGSDAKPNVTFVNSKKIYTVLTEDDIKKRQEDQISRVSVVLSISEVAASRLLYYYKWNVSQLHDVWFADEDKVREEVGLPSMVVPFSTIGEPITCGICFDVLPQEDFYPVVCGHMYCKTCWRGYITTSINDGSGCLSLRCPEPSCRVAICRDMVDDLGTQEEREKYHRFYLRAYVEESRKIKWCPNAGCENAVESELGSNIFDVICLCLGGFCWNCGEDAHRPVKCETVSKWVLKNSSEAENTKWILANSKPCPMCKRYIEKNMGCMHMTCTAPCKYQFCWLCLGDWKQHGEQTGGFYACNKYEDAKKKGLYDEEEKKREMAKSSLHRYTHYYERWAANQKSREKAINDLKALETGVLTVLRNKTSETEAQLKCIIEAWEQIIECRRVLKWTYAYGYYLPEDEPLKKHMFEYNQGVAEAQLERLHNCVEKELNSSLEKDDKDDKDKKDDKDEKDDKDDKDEKDDKDDKDDKDEKDDEDFDFGKFRTKLVGLTSVTKTYFTQLVDYFETQNV